MSKCTPHQRFAVCGPTYIEDWLLVAESGHLDFGKQYWSEAQERRVPGGGALNVFRHLVDFGCRAALISTCGDDIAGNLLKGKLQGFQEEAEVALHVKSYSTCMSVNVVSSETGESVFVISGEANKGFAVEMTEPYMGPSDILILCAYAKMESLWRDLPRHISMLQKRPKIYLDTGRLNPHDFDAFEAMMGIFPYLELLKVNHTEFLGLCRSDEIRPAIRRLREDHGLLNIVITQGKEGCFVVPSGEEALYHINPILNGRDSFVSTAGAGDAFLARLAYRFGSGASLLQAADEAAAFAEYFLRSKNGILRGYI